MRAIAAWVGGEPCAGRAARGTGFRCYCSNEQQKTPLPRTSAPKWDRRRRLGISLHLQRISSKRRPYRHRRRLRRFGFCCFCRESAANGRPCRHSARRLTAGRDSFIRGECGDFTVVCDPTVGPAGVRDPVCAVCRTAGAIPYYPMPDGRMAALRPASGLPWGRRREESPGSTEARCRVTPGGGDPRESATETHRRALSPMGRVLGTAAWDGMGGKGEMVR